MRLVKSTSAEMTDAVYFLDGPLQVKLNVRSQHLIYTQKSIPGMNFKKFAECSGGIFIEMFSFTALLQLSFGFTPFIAF